MEEKIMLTICWVIMWLGIFLTALSMYGSGGR